MRIGEPTHFIRLTGCNLHCEFCDTQYSWESGQELPTAQIVEEIIDKNRSFPAEWVCFTGGEPLIQELDPLVNSLQNEGFKTQIETNGHFFQSISVDWYTLSPKPDRFFFHPEYQINAKEVKLVVTRDLSLTVIKDLRKLFPKKTPFFLQPQSMQEWSLDLAFSLLQDSVRDGLKNLRLGTQLHKIYNIS
ncbi:7-carboxy-7-deazaguanine synthase QueE [Acidobacteriota bacterium]